MEIRKAAPQDITKVIAFYQSRLPGYEISNDDLIYVALDGGKVVGVVRLVEEYKFLILRGMQIDSNYQRSGLGSKLLNILDTEIGRQECYCLPYAHLERFYSQIGFKKIPETVAPKFLEERVKKYQKDADNIIMHRPPACHSL